MGTSRVGTVFKKRPTDRKWRGAFYPPGGGKRRIVTLFTDKRASEIELAKMIRREERIVAGLEDAPPPDTSVHELLDAYLVHCAYSGQSRRHLGSKKVQILRILDHAAVGRIEDLRLEDAEAVLRRLSTDGLSPRTINIHINSLKAFVRFAVQRGHPMGGRFDALTKLDERADVRRRRRALSQDEIERLLRAARLRPVADYGRASVRLDPGPAQGRRTWVKEPLTRANLDAAYQRGRKVLRRNHAANLDRLERLARDRFDFYTLLLYTGMRLGEARALRWEDVDLDERFIRIPASNSKSKREDEVPIHSVVVSMLKRRSEIKQAGKMFVTVPSIRAFDLDLQAAGIDKKDASGRVVDLHALRTTTGTLLARAGVSPQLAQRILRHADINVTLNHYTHLDRSDRVKAIQMIG